MEAGLRPWSLQKHSLEGFSRLPCIDRVHILQLDPLTGHSLPSSAMVGFLSHVDITAELCPYHTEDDQCRCLLLLCGNRPLPSVCLLNKAWLGSVT